MDIFSKFIEFFKGLPLWIRILYGLVVIALAVVGGVEGWITFLDNRKATVEKEQRDWEVEFADVRKTIRIEDGPQRINSTVDGLVNDARTDAEKCDVGLWFLDFTGNSSAYQLPLGVVLVIQTSNDPCVSMLKQAALAIQQHQSPTSTAAPKTAQIAVIAPAGSQVEARNSISSQIVRSATTEGTSGWVYLGILSQSGRLGPGRTISSLEPPSPNEEITTVVNLNLRDSIDSSDHVGKIVGVIPQGSTLRVIGAPLIFNHADTITGQIIGRVAWVPVNLEGKASAPPSTAAPAPTPTAAIRSLLVSAYQHGETAGFAFQGEIIKVFKVLDAHSTGIYVRNVGTRSVYIDINPACSNVVQCPPITDVRVDPVKAFLDASNDYIYTANTLEQFAFAWRIQLR